MELNLDTLEYTREEKVKDAFYASDVLRPAFELYHRFIGTKETNPIKWYDTLKMGAGNGVEEAMLRVLKDSGVVDKEYNQHEHGKVSYDKHGVPIHGRIDAITKQGIPIEIKSINNKNAWDIMSYENNMPRENYVGQLSVYMDYLGVDTGYLFVASVDGLNRFWFECKRNGDVFTCGRVKFDLAKEIKRWKNLWDNHVVPRVEPDPFEYIYKYKIEELDWKTISADKISKARNNKAVIGDYQVGWSGYKDLWISRQGETAGYTAEELIKINELTTGYSTWKKK